MYLHRGPFLEGDNGSLYKMESCNLFCPKYYVKSTESCIFDNGGTFNFSWASFHER